MASSTGDGDRKRLAAKQKTGVQLRVRGIKVKMTNLHADLLEDGVSLMKVTDGMTQRGEESETVFSRNT